MNILRSVLSAVTLLCLVAACSSDPKDDAPTRESTMELGEAMGVTSACSAAFWTLYETTWGKSSQLTDDELNGADLGPLRACASEDDYVMMAITLPQAVGYTYLAEADAHKLVATSCEVLAGDLEGAAVCAW